MIPAHDLPVTGLCAASGVDVDAVTVSADHKLVRLKLFGKDIVAPSQGRSGVVGWLLIFMAAVAAVYVKVVIDTFCGGNAVSGAGEPTGNEPSSLSKCHITTISHWSS